MFRNKFYRILLQFHDTFKIFIQKATGVFFKDFKIDVNDSLNDNLDEKDSFNDNLEVVCYEESRMQPFKCSFGL